MKSNSTWLISSPFLSLLYQPVFAALELPKVDLGYEVHQAISFNVSIALPYPGHPFLISHPRSPTRCIISAIFDLPKLQ